MTENSKGIVYLVGAGPGDTSLITVKGRRCIEESDVLVYDYLAADSLLKYSGDNTEKIYVGKKGGDHTLSQEGINNLIVKLAKEGKKVCRLKGGDPFIFGRGGEEAEILVENGIEFEIVPGVTSAIAASAYAGIPLTHRDANSTLAFVTGHEDPLKQSSSIDWKSLAGGIGTIVFFMGVKNIGNISKNLIENGKDSKTPVALIRWGTTSRQEVLKGNLENIAEKVKESKFKAPAIIVVGKVAEYRDKLKWFEPKRPLLGKKIVVTRARVQASGLVEKLENLGAECIEYPTIKIEHPSDRFKEELDKAIDKINDYQWLIFTSVNGVKFFFEALFNKGLDVRALGHVKTAVIGPATKDELRKYGINSDIMPESYYAESVVESFKNIDLKDKKILLPRAMEARSVLPDELSKMGALIDEIPVYETKPVTDKKDEIVKLFMDEDVDMITFTSSSTVKNFKSLFSEDEFLSIQSKIKAASIGPVTTETAVNLGIDPVLTADEFTIDGLISSIVEYFKN